MLNVAIVEDDKIYAQQIAEYLLPFGKENAETIEFTAYKDGYELVEKYKSEFDIILMDVQMPLLDGMSAAEEIRRKDPEVIIIFITNMAQHAIRGYAVDALDYVLKPVSYFAFSQRMNRAIMRMKRRETFYLAIPIRHGIKKLDVSQICYIESRGHTLMFRTLTDRLISSGKMADMEQELQGMFFYRGNKGYLINLRHVDSVQDNFAIVDGEKVLLSRSRKKGFMIAVTNYIGNLAK